MSANRLTPEQAVARAEEGFPFKGYFTGDRMAWLTVGRIVTKYLPNGAKLYDLGAGACDKTAVAQHLGCQCTAMDDLADDWYKRGQNIERIEAYAREKGINFSRVFSPPPPDSFDMVMLNDVMEHIHDSPRELLNSLVTGLKTGGLLFITVPNLANIRKRIDLMRGKSNLPNYDLYYWYRGPWRGPQREYVRGDLISMSKNLGVDVVELTTVHHMLGNLPSALHPAYKLVTAIFPSWRDTWLLVARKPEGWTAKTELNDAEFARIYGTSSNEQLYVAN
jgi:SAM-dependent methyltransferase